MNVGIVKGLLTLPFAPVRGVVWIGERLAEQAENELFDEQAIRRQLSELQMALDMEAISEDEYAREEYACLERLIEVRRLKEGSGGYA
jgi:hypothetical protein